MKLLIRIFISLFFLTSTVNAAEFGLAFEWGDTPKCNTVPSREHSRYKY